MSTTWTHDDLRQIEKAMASGTLIVKFKDRQIQYRSLDEMERVRLSIRKALGLVAPGRRRTLANFDSDL